MRKDNLRTLTAFHCCFCDDACNFIFAPGRVVFDSGCSCLVHKQEGRKENGPIAPPAAELPVEAPDPDAPAAPPAAEPSVAAPVLDPPEWLQREQHAVVEACCDDVATGSCMLMDCVPRNLARLSDTELFDVDPENRPKDWFHATSFWPRVFHGIVKDHRVERTDCRVATALVSSFAGLVLLLTAVWKC